MASLQKQDSRYYLQFYDRKRTPTRKRVALKTTRKSPARTKQRELEDAYVEGRYDPWTDDPFGYARESLVRNLSVSEALGRFTRRKKQEGCTAATIRTYEKLIGRLPEGPLRGLTKSDLVSFIHAPGISQATKRKRYTHVRAFLNWQVREGHLRSSPHEEVPTPRRHGKLPKHVRPEELATICKEIRSDYRKKREGGICSEGEVIWLIPLYRFALYTGLRGSELARLRWEDVRLEERRLHIRKAKSRREETVPLTRKAREILDGVERRGPHVFGFDCEPPRRADTWRDMVSRRFRKYRDEANIERPITLHGLRHGFCTLLAEAGKSAIVIKEAARHADIKTSMQYVHMARERLQQELDDVF